MIFTTAKDAIEAIPNLNFPVLIIGKYFTSYEEFLLPVRISNDKEFKDFVYDIRAWSYNIQLIVTSEFGDSPLKSTDNYP